MTHGNDMKYKFQYPQIKFHWNTATFIHFKHYLWLLQSYNGRIEKLVQKLYGPQSPKWYLLSEYQKKFANPPAIQKRFQAME